MPYLGKSPSFGVRQRYQYTATASQTTFSGTDTANLTLNYTDNNFVDVYQNGVLLKGGGNDYTATSGTSVVLGTGATADDVIEIIVYDAFSAANFYSRTDSDSRYALTTGATMSGALDLNGQELILDADADTSITADTDDQIDIKIAGADDFAFKANTFEVQTGSNIDMNGTELILDADGDTSITADTDDQIDIKIAGSDSLRIKANEIENVSGDLLIDTVGSTIIDSDGDGEVVLKDGGTQYGQFFKDGNDLKIVSSIQDGDIVLRGNDGGSGVNALTVDMSQLGGVLINPSTYNNNTSASASMVVTSGGSFARSTSSRRHKNTINDATHGLAELLKLRSVTYKGNSTNNDGDTVFGGLIAEEVHDVGLTEFVVYDDQNRPDALHYGHMVALCVKAIQELSAKNDALEARIKKLEDG